MAEVNVKIKAQNQTRTGFQQALGDAQRFGNTASGSLRSAFAGVASDIKSSIGGALAGLASIGAIKSVIDQFGRIQDLSEQFGVSAETLQRFGQLASESGSSIDQMAAAFSRLTINIQKAQGETGAQADAMRTLGLSASEMANLSPEQAFLKLADALKSSGGTNEAYSATLALIGNRQQNLIPLLQQGAEAIKAQSQGIAVASDETVAKVDAIADRFQRLGQQLAVGFGPILGLIGEKLLGGFSVIEAAVGKFTSSITSSVMAIGEVLKGNFSGAGEIMRAEAQRTGAQWEALVKKLDEINAPPTQRQGRGALGAIEAQLDEQNNTTRDDGRGTRRGNVTGQQLGPGDFEGIEQFRREQEAARRALGPEFGPGTAEAATGGFRVDAAMFQQQRAEEAARLLMQQQQQAFQGSSGASAFQRVGLATNEFFDTRKAKDPATAIEKGNKLLQQIKEALSKGEPLVLNPTSS
jgi:hypothetical protein